MISEDINPNDLPYVVTHHPSDGTAPHVMAAFTYETDARSLIDSTLFFDYRLWKRLDSGEYTELKVD